MPTPKSNRWHPVMLPDNYIKKMKQDIRELEAQIESKTRLIPFFEDDPPPDSDFSPPPDDDPLSP